MPSCASDWKLSAPVPSMTVLVGLDEEVRGGR